jgi:hypothetical protein
MSYDGPLALQVDDTLLTPAIRAYQDDGQWRVAGMDRLVKNFDTYEQLGKLVQEISRDNIAEKVCMLRLCNLLIQLIHLLLALPLPPQYTSLQLPASYPCSSADREQGLQC